MMDEPIQTTVCFTGHRIIPSEHLPWLRERLEKTVEELYACGYRTFLAGGALGFDTLAASAVLALKKQRCPELKLELMLPCADQTKCWKERDVRLYESILKQADKVTCMSERYYNGCMQARNRALVENSSVCVCYLTRNSGGTAQSVRMAKQKGLRLINLALCERF